MTTWPDTRRARRFRPLSGVGLGLALGGVLALGACPRSPQPAPESHGLVAAADPAEHAAARPDGDVVLVQGADEVAGRGVVEGYFRMGRPARQGFTDEQPEHLVKVKRFRLDRTEVSNEAYAAFLNVTDADEHPQAWMKAEAATGLTRAGGLGWRVAPGRATWPAVGVTWFGAAAYCKWKGGRLPTEAEWEWAAVGPEWRVYPWGDDSDPKKCCCSENPGRPYVDVDAYPEGASWCGALNIAGNCWEWCADWYGPYRADKQENARGPAEGTERVIRGGFYKNASDLFRGSCRLRQAPTVGRDGIGFRCAYDAPPR